MSMHNDHMAYQDGMEDIGSEILERVVAEGAAYNSDAFSPEDVRTALEKERLGIRDFAALLSPAAESFLQPMAERAKDETARYFGNGVRLFTPLYIANYCVNHCTYCGFSCKNKILRGKLTLDEISREFEAIAATGLDEILLLTGESRKMSDTDYIGEAVKIAAQYFGAVGVEIYPLNTGEYARLRELGADFVSVYQETYIPEIYDRVHPAGPKRSYPYRFNAQERAIRGGMRGVSFGALFGLGEFCRDAYSAGLHAYFLQKKYPHAEVSFSAPRIRLHSSDPLYFEKESGQGGTERVSERKLLQALSAYRIFMPFAGITISSRERAGFRDNVAGMCATRISAGVSVGVGGHESEMKGGEQFEIADARSVDEIYSMLRGRGLQPVYTDYIRV